ncbi:MAG: Fic family protein [Nitrospirae bacterium]|nr:Fic family protein [Nitrospirota bacterium]MDE3218225.1 Fic family protein [Nitrospirota bacterium]
MLPPSSLVTSRGWGLIDVPLRASNEGLLRPRVARAQKIISRHPLIHPFREGNGRAARILAVLMGLQAGLPALLFDKLSGRKRRRYFAAVQAGLDRNYGPMTTLFTAVIERTVQVHEKR